MYQVPVDVVSTLLARTKPVIAGGTDAPAAATLDRTVLPAVTEPRDEYAITLTEIVVFTSVSVRV